MTHFQLWAVIFSAALAACAYWMHRNGEFSNFKNRGK